MNFNKIKRVNFWLQICSLSADIFAQRMLKNSIDDVIDDTNLPNEVKVELNKLTGVGVKSNLLSKLDNFPRLKDWVNGLDETTNANLINKVDDLEDTYWSKLNTDLASTSNGNELKTLITTGDDVGAWKLLKDDAGYAFELGEDGLGVWEKWGKTNFFKVVTKKGKDFENLVCLKKFKNRLSDKYLELKDNFSIDFGKDLDEYDMFSQVQLKYNNAGDYFVADQVFVKYDAFNEIEDVVVIENKLSSGTRLTPNQNIAKTKNSYTVRNTQEKISEFGTGKELNKNI